MQPLALIFLAVFLAACDVDHDASRTVVDTISGREQQNDLWHIRRPVEWTLKDASPSLRDSRLANKEYEIEDAISLVIHSFPSQTIEKRIPPLAQVQRWKAQFDRSPPPQFHLSPQAFSGYAGFLLEGEGRIKGKEVRMLAWALSLSPKAYFSLKNPESRSEITIKVVGSEEMVNLHEESILKAVRTLGLIEAIP